jgi:hypothetical protein
MFNSLVAEADAMLYEASGVQSSRTGDEPESDAKLASQFWPRHMPISFQLPPRLTSNGHSSPPQLFQNPGIALPELLTRSHSWLECQPEINLQCRKLETAGILWRT